MKFPAHVNEIKKHLEVTKNDHLKIMRTLTETENLAYRKDLESMWKTLFNAEKKYDGAQSSEWVLMFINSVIFSMEEKPYFSMNKQIRTQKLQKIGMHTKELKKLYRELDLDEPLLMFDPEYFYLWNEAGEPIRDINLLPVFGIVEALDFYQNNAIEDVGRYVSGGKIGKRYKSNRFIKKMGERNLRRYGKPLLPALIRSAFFIYGEEYSQQDASNLIKGRRAKAA